MALISSNLGSSFGVVAAVVATACAASALVFAAAASAAASAAAFVARSAARRAALAFVTGAFVVVGAFVIVGAFLTLFFLDAVVVGSILFIRAKILNSASYKELHTDPPQLRKLVRQPHQISEK